MARKISYHISNSCTLKFILLPLPSETFHKLTLSSAKYTFHRVISPEEHPKVPRNLQHVQKFLLVNFCSLSSPPIRPSRMGELNCKSHDAKRGCEWRGRSIDIHSIVSRVFSKRSFCFSSPAIVLCCRCMGGRYTREWNALRVYTAAWLHFSRVSRKNSAWFSFSRTKEGTPVSRRVNGIRRILLLEWKHSLRLPAGFVKQERIFYLEFCYGVDICGSRQMRYWIKLIVFYFICSFRLGRYCVGV